MLDHLQAQLEQLERLCSEDTHHRPMITYTIDQFILDPKSKQNKIKVTNLKNSPKLKIFKFYKILHSTHQLKLLDKICK